MRRSDRGGHTAVEEGLHRGAGLCADIGGSFIKFAAVNAGGRLASTQLRATPSEDWAAFSGALVDLCRGVSPQLDLSVSLAGIVDPQTGLAFSANIPCINGRQLAQDLGATLDRHVRIANDADCMALAEAMNGAGRGHAVVFAIILGSGVGGGLVVDGHIVGGAGGIAGEWGHGPVLGPILAGGETIPPQPCGCGQVGCLDTLGGAHGLQRLHRLLHGESLASREICAGWHDDDPRAKVSIETWLPLVAGPLAMVVNATGAGIAPVAGGLGNDARLMTALDAAVRARVLRRGDAPIVVPSHFGDGAGLVGAALLLRGQTRNGAPA